MPATSYLKSAWAKKDADGDYWLFIKGDGLKAAFCLSRKQNVTNSMTGEVTVTNDDAIERRALAAWLAEQDKSNGDSNKSVEVLMVSQVYIVSLVEDARLADRLRTCYAILAICG